MLKILHCFNPETSLLHNVNTVMNPVHQADQKSGFLISIFTSNCFSLLNSFLVLRQEEAVDKLMAT